MASRKSSYRGAMELEKHLSSGFIGTLSESLQGKLSRYYEALSGEYRYLDSHTGKTVRARTYNKRVEFAQKELDGIRRHLLLEARMGVADQEKHEMVQQYLGSLYALAIKKNEYLIGEERKVRGRSRLNLSLWNLNPSLEEIAALSEMRQNMKTPTGYTYALQNTISQDVAEMGEVTYRNRHIDINPADAKLPDSAPINWPISPEQAERREKKKRGYGIFGRAFRAAAAGLVLLMAGGRKESEEEIVPVDLHAPAGAESYGNEVDLEAPTYLRSPMDDNYSEVRVNEIRSQRAESIYTPEQEKARIKRAWEKVRQYEEEIRRNKEIERLKVVESRPVVSMHSPKASAQKDEKIGSDWEKIFYAHWDRKSKEREKDNIVTRSVTYHSDGHVTVWDAKAQSAKYVSAFN